MSATGVIWTAAMLALGGGYPAPDSRDAVVPRDAVVIDGTVVGLQVLPALNNTEILVSLSGIVETRDFTMQGPDRIVLDLLNASLGQASLDGEVNRGGIRRVRLTQYAPDIVRVVLEVDGPAQYAVASAEGFVRISMENPWGDFTFLPWTAGPTTSAGVLPASTALAGIVSPPMSAGPLASSLSTTRSGLQLQEQSIVIDYIFFDEVPLSDVLRTFGDIAGRSILIGTGSSLPVNAEIRDQPWDVALQSILDIYGFAAKEEESGIIQVLPLETLQARDDLEPLMTQAYRVNYANAVELQPVVQSLLTERGSLAPSAGTNTIVVNDVARVLSAVGELLQGLDRRPPSISIGAKIVFVDRTDLDELGVVYDVKDSQGNQLNQVTPGGIDRDGNGIISAEPDDDEIVPTGTNVISLGGNSIAALGNANQRVVSPSIQFLTSVVLGRHSLVSFLEALQSVQLSDIQAAPQITGLDNQLSEIVVGQETPIRVIDVGTGAAGAQGGTTAPQATVDIVETGIILRVTPHVTTGDLIWMELEAERSGIAVAEADLGFTFDTQRALTRVLVADGQTAVIGGLTVTERTEVRAGIPLLQDLPLIGRFFRLTRERTNQRDLIILVTPQIIRD